ncbi:Sialidase [bioreactor metagenome]|uniref:Sialidase n=1 Tax=bioreactor metagenome TaxID=1076179 RepID=A0A645FWQ3_9ZZZZ
MITYSDDNGYTWTSHKNITEAVSHPFQITNGYHYTFKEDWRWYAIGPGHAIQLQQPPYRGRLLFPCNHIEGDRSYDADYSHVFYSDDFGKTWCLGGCVNQQRTNECMAVELSNGDVMLNCRRIDGQTRYSAISHNGGTTWEHVGLDLPDPGCQGSILRFTLKDQTKLLFCNASDPTERKHLTVRMSNDDGKTWTVEKCICEGFSAYSDMVIQENGSIGILYEAENYLKIKYCHFDLAWLTDSTDYHLHN